MNQSEAQDLKQDSINMLDSANPRFILEKMSSKAESERRCALIKALRAGISNDSDLNQKRNYSYQNYI